MISETYRDIEIVLLEEENKWRFTVNGRERTAATLPKARTSIDNALDEVRTKKVKAWAPFEAYYKSYHGSEFQVVTVTSQAEENDYNGRPKFWINNKNKSRRGFGEVGRSKEDSSALYAITPENDALIAEYQSLLAQRDEIDATARRTMERIKHIEAPKSTQ